MSILFILVVFLRADFGNFYEVCYGDLGCFSMDYPWTSEGRPLPVPQNPNFIDTRLHLYTKNTSKFILKLRSNYTRSTWMAESDFNASRPYTVFIAHGFLNSANFNWPQEMKDAYLRKRDANVFVVDWGIGAINLDYTQSASNTRVVGAEVAKFIKMLTLDHALKVESVHIIGHSLGAQIASYIGKAFEGKLAKITGLDPAQPGFEGEFRTVRFFKTDAVFVEALHTNIRPFILTGFGMIRPTADVDIYANNGILMPGCVSNSFFGLKTNIHYLHHWERMTNVLSCSHMRSIHYYIEAIHRDDCTFWAYALDDFTLRRLQNSDGNQIISVQPFKRKCSRNTCTILGLDVEKYPARGAFAFPTNEQSPFCQKNEHADRIMKDFKPK